MSRADHRPALLSVFLPAAVLLQTACGYIGGPLPPLANVPARVVDLAAVQRGAKIIVQFTLPLVTTENITIKDPLTLDLRIGPGANPFNSEQWSARAKTLTPPATSRGTVRYEIPAAEWTGREVVLALRTVAANGKASDWSNFVTLQPVPPPAEPTGVRADSTAAGVRLTWNAPGEHFRILRKGAAEQNYSIVGADVHTPEFLDATAAVGTEYTYLVQTFVPQGETREAQSDLSADFKFTRLAPLPTAPAGLLAVPAADSIELNWDSNSAPETTGYRIYRATGAAEFSKIGEVSAIPTYSDRAVEHGKTYRYAIAAIDSQNRESNRSAIVEVTFP